MSTYQKLLTTCKPTAIVEGSEGLVDNVLNFVSAIFQKIIDGFKWIWNFITGGSGGKSTEKMSEEVDKAVTAAPKVIVKIQEDTKKLYNSIKRDYAASTPEAKTTGRKIEELLSKKHKGEITSEQMFEDFNKVMLGEESKAADKALETAMKPIKEANTAVAKIMKDNGVKTVNSESVKEDAATVVAAALQDKPLPKKDINDMIGLPYMGNLGMWFCRTTDVIGRSNVEVEGRQAKPVDAVNSALKNSCNKLVKTIEDLTSILKSIDVSPDVSNETAKKVVEEWEGFDGKNYQINDYVGLEFKLNDGVVNLKGSFNKKEDVGNIICVVNYDTFKRITTHSKEYNQRISTFKSEINKVEKKLTSGLKLISDKPDSIKDVESFKLVLKVTKEKLAACTTTIKLTEHLMQTLLDFGAAPMKWLA